MIEVRIRASGQTTSKHLTDVPLQELNTVLEVLSAWGVRDMDGNLYERDGINGQFCVDYDGAYFEFVLTEEDAV